MSLFREALIDELLRTSERLHVLELGAGKGHLALRLARKGAIVTAVDSMSSSELASAANEVRVFIDDVTRPVTKWRDDTFDLIVAVNLFESLTAVERSELFSTMRRRLSPQGAIYFSVLSQLDPSYSEARRAGLAECEPGSFRHDGQFMHFWTQDELRTVTAGAELRLLECHRIDFEDSDGHLHTALEGVILRADGE